MQETTAGGEGVGGSIQLGGSWSTGLWKHSGRAGPGSPVVLGVIDVCSVDGGMAVVYAPLLVAVPVSVPSVKLVRSVPGVNVNADAVLLQVELPVEALETVEAGDSVYVLDVPVVVPVSVPMVKVVRSVPDINVYADEVMPHIELEPVEDVTLAVPELVPVFVSMVNIVRSVPGVSENEVSVSEQVAVLELDDCCVDDVDKVVDFSDCVDFSCFPSVDCLLLSFSFLSLGSSDGSFAGGFGTGTFGWIGFISPPRSDRSPFTFSMSSTPPLISPPRCCKEFTAQDAAPIRPPNKRPPELQPPPPPPPPPKSPRKCRPKSLAVSISCFALFKASVSDG